MSIMSGEVMFISVNCAGWGTVFNQWHDLPIINNNNNRKVGNIYMSCKLVQNKHFLWDTMYQNLPCYFSDCPLFEPLRTVILQLFKCIIYCAHSPIECWNGIKASNLTLSFTLLSKKQHHHTHHVPHCWYRLRGNGPSCGGAPRQVL